ncbi:hypothetical protein IH980_03990 [Patescibacteria group bacterium]|nr:hypothetical protein [Patescibacteria group bacterium]
MKHQKRTRPRTYILEKVVASWLKYDPLISVVVKNDEHMRRDVMLNLIGPGAAARHFGKFKALKPEDGPIYPNLVREAVDGAINNTGERKKLIKKLVFWATDPGVNNRYIKSHLTRIQIVMSLLGPIFFRASAKEDDLILKGLKYMAAQKPTTIGIPGERSLEVHEVLLTRVIDMLMHNQKVIISKTMSEAEEKMRVQLMRQVQELRGKKYSTPLFVSDLKATRQQWVKEKFPLRQDSVSHLEDLLRFYSHCTWPELQFKATQATQKIREMRKPFTLTSQDETR